MKKGQAFAWDLVFGIMIFMMTLLMVIQIWQTAYDDIRASEEEYEMTWLAETVSEQLIRTAGDPHDWTPDNVIAYGLAESRGLGGVVESRVLDADKLLHLIDMLNRNYSAARGRLLGSGRYEVYIEVSCLNRTDLYCLQGIPLNSVRESVGCSNQRIRVNTYNRDYRFTDVYLWLEAEDLWGNPVGGSVCQKGCSGGNMSAVNSASPAKIKIRPGEYMLWARIIGDGTASKIVVDGVEYPLFNMTYDGLVGWVWVGNMTLSSEVTLGFADTVAGNYVDAILLSTDRFYDPRDPYYFNTYGNPNINPASNVSEPCYVGNRREGAETISRFKTAVMGLPFSGGYFFGGGKPAVEDIVSIKVVVWGGTALPPRNRTVESTTTTTLKPPVSVNCTPSGDVRERCVSNNMPVINIYNVTVRSGGVETDTIECGIENPLTVKWRGRHAGDRNYFAFFANNGSYFLGACASNNTDNEEDQTIYSYDMNCTINPPPNLGLPDGEHQLIVTGEDYGGYCYPRGTNQTAYQDDEERRSVQLRSCVTYTDIQCTPIENYAQRCINNPKSVDKIYEVEVSEGTDTITCGVDTKIETRWGGTHGTAGELHWTYVLEDGGTRFVAGACKSSRTDNPQITYYNMTCNINLDRTTGCGGGSCTSFDGREMDLYVVGESDISSYCTDPYSTYADAVGSRRITLSCSSP